MKIALIFPGQGSQYVGMGKDLLEIKEAKEVFELADQVLNFKLSNIFLDGPEDELRLTINTQPAILTHSIALWNILKKYNLPISFVAGHSLGEFSALVANESLTFTDAVKLVRLRGKFMEEAVPNGTGAMAAVLGIDKGLLENVCEKVSNNDDIVEMVNINSPGQIVISGTKKGVEDAALLAKELGAKRVIPLAVSGPFHSKLMKPAADKLKSYIEQLNFNDVKIPLVTNVLGVAIQSKEEIKENIIKQIYSPVLWEDSINWMINKGVNIFIEVGPGNVLSGLVKKINKNVNAYSIQEYNSLIKITSEIKLILEGESNVKG